MEIVGLIGFLGLIVCIGMLIAAFAKKRPKKKILIGMVVCFILFSGAVSATDDDDGAAENGKNSEQPTQVTQQDESEPRPNAGDSILDETLDISEYLRFDAEMLFEYGNYFSGENVVTVISVYQTGSDIKAKTENNDGYFYSLVLEFENKEIPKQVEKGDVLTIAGTIKEKPETIDLLEFLETPTVTLVNCSIVGYGEIAQELKDSALEQQAVGAQRKAEYEALIAAAKKGERDDYIAQCQTVSYNDVARNPDNYKGQLVKISGKVVQVSEGFLDSVTLRVDCNGNVWLVTYTRKDGESRILENDRITCYGECNGVTSYTTVLGSQVTIPSMRMEYYD